MVYGVRGHLMIVYGKRTFLCLGCGKPFEIDTIKYDHPEAPEMLCTGPGFIGITPGDNDDPGHMIVSLTCSKACCETFLKNGAEGMEIVLEEDDEDEAPVPN